MIINQISKPQGVQDEKVLLKLQQFVLCFPTIQIYWFKNTYSKGDFSILLAIDSLLQQHWQSEFRNPQFQGQWFGKWNVSYKYSIEISICCAYQPLVVYHCHFEASILYLYPMGKYPRIQCFIATSQGFYFHRSQMVMAPEWQLRLHDS